MNLKTVNQNIVIDELILTPKAIEALKSIQKESFKGVTSESLTKATLHLLEFGLQVDPGKPEQMMEVNEIAYSISWAHNMLLALQIPE